MSKKEYKNKEYLQEQYLEKQRSTVEISNKFDVAPSAISYWLDKHNINIRSISESLSGRKVNEETKQKISNSVSKHHKENEHPFKGESHSEESKKKMSEAKMGERNPNYNKERPEHSERMSGSENPSWKGGKTDEMDFRKQTKWQNFSDELREKADWTCENCGVHGSKAEIQTHHAHPVSDGGSKFDNVFIILCKECHGNKSSFWHNSTVSEQIAKINDKPI